ncbi:universal stress protein [Rhizobium sp. L1K21]|uniref:universal stress protein n=1 Tax=Rhizobium sp. L1K21 TaxID=2954933 RepID=UPI0020925FC1|nr:universal stress protein [Rhizobium sp. L1K21]MCO6186737.1 universal stress protein [Rhizobium sp. L1K21]
MYKKIIVPVDLSQEEKGRKIARKAVELLDEGGEIVLLNVVEDVPGYLAIDLPADVVEKTRTNAVDALKAMRAELFPSARVEVRVGAPARNILASAAENEADLVIVASHCPDLSNYLLGSTADRVVRHAKISVLVDR